MSSSESDKMDVEKSSDDDSMSSMDTSYENKFSTLLDKLMEVEAVNAELKIAVEKRQKTIHHQNATIRGLEQNKWVVPYDKNSSSGAKDKGFLSTSGNESETVLEKLLEKKAENVKMKTLFEEQQATIARQCATILRLYKEKFTAIQDRIVTVYDATTADGEIDYDQLNQKTLVIDTLEFENDVWLADGIEISLDGLAVKPWLTTKLDICETIDMSYALKLFECKGLKSLTLCRQSISYDQYKKLATTNTKDLFLAYLTVKNGYGCDTDIADLLKKVPNIERFEYYFKDGQKVTPEAIRNLVQLQPFHHLNEFLLFYSCDKFNLEAFAEFIKKNPKAEYQLYFQGSSPSIVEEVTKDEEKIRPALPESCKLMIHK